MKFIEHSRIFPTRLSPQIIAFIFLAGIGLLLTACSSTAVVETPIAVSQLIRPSEYQEVFADPESHLLIDVRTPEEFNAGHIAGAVNIPVESLASRLDEVPANEPIVVYCRSGNRSATAAGILTGAGYKPVYDLGGILDWVEQGNPVVVPVQ